MGLYKKIAMLLNLRKNNAGKKAFKDGADISRLRELTQQEALTTNLENNLSLIKTYLGNSFGLQIRKIKIGPGNIDGALVFIEGMVNSVILEEILRSLLVNTQKPVELPGVGQAFLSFIQEKIISSPEVTEAKELDALFEKVLFGSTALLFDGIDTALIVDTKGWKTRAITESDAEVSIRGVRENFIESLNDNLSLIRRRIRVPQLWVEVFHIGSLTRTQVAIAYIKGLAGEELLEEVRTRLQKIDTDSIMESGDIEDFVEDNPFTLLPLTLRTERVDRVTAALLEGQVAIITDGTPFVLIAPATFFGMLQAPDDHWEKKPIGSFLRLLRYTAFLISTFLPGLYVAVINFHQELIPTDLFVRIASTREGVPFPAVFELILLELVFEVLREAGVRLPAAIGPAISIVGALVLGDAAIRAGLVSPPVVVIVALTAIASFTVPNFALGIAGRLLRFLFIALGSIFGLFGIQFGLFLLLIHLCALRSFGVPYLAPAAPMIWQDMKDFLIVVWRWGLTTRPRLTGFREPIRQDPRQPRRYVDILSSRGDDSNNED